MPSYPTLAGTDLQTANAPKQLFVGSEVPEISDAAVAAADIAQHQLIAVLVNGTVVPFDPATHVAAQAAVAAVAAANTKQCPYHLDGQWNHEVIGWPAAWDTYNKRREGIAGSMLSIGHLKG